MRMTFGRHKGKTLEIIALKDPEFIRDLLASEAKGKDQIRLRAEASQLLDTFDRRAFQVRCVGSGCNQPASRCTIYKSDVLNPWWWCDACDPKQYGIGPDRIRIVRTYQDALDFCEPFGDPTVARDIIRVLAEAKGLPGLKEAHADIFFNG